MVYTGGAVSIEHGGVARVFYSKLKPRVRTINHKPRLSQLICKMQSCRPPSLGTCTCTCSSIYQSDQSLLGGSLLCSIMP